ncbi:hypothetical protein K2173_024360 [Erythroxylum novogranatense]|uniref:Cation/H+ exchanger domain-containing protein n=1 Tax=Erythroxylum novogranatense TaxID=1862640 RepID=A0AAV8SU62_9ROSI|nr:hypothetical protein K2173_024360 [Erythroxylum novogranatense]
MDAAGRAMCLDDPINPLITTTLQASGILVLSHFFHLILKPFGQSGPIAQIMAGVVLSPTLLSRIHRVREFFIQSSSAEYYEVFSSVFGILFIFLIGLETDIPYIKRNLQRSITVALGGVVVCGIFGLAVSLFIIEYMKILNDRLTLVYVIMIVVANTASPVVIRLAAELKFATSDVGRLGISASLISEMCCVLWFSLYFAFRSWKMFGRGILFILMTLALIFLNKYLAFWCNQRNHTQKYVTNTEVLVILFLLIGLAFTIEKYEYNSMICCFFVGLAFPREGKTMRTLLRKLNYAVYNFILPIYFGYVGFQLNLNYLNSYRNITVTALLIFLSFGGKIIGVLAACHHLKIPKVEAVFLGLLLSVKGHAELLLIQTIPSETLKNIWNRNVHNLVIIVVVLDTVIAGPAIAIILRQQEKYFIHKSTPLELHDPESELRLMSCVYGSRHISAKIGLVLAFNGFLQAPYTAYLVHLVELPNKHRKKNLMYHQLQDGDQFSDEEDYGGNDVLEINDAVDASNMENKLFIHQLKVVSTSDKMFEDVCDSVEDLRTSIVIITFHKHQRLDEKMESGKEDMRTTNQKVLRYAPCSVGIFVDRGQTGFQQPRPELVQHVAALFFGGPDDREALACSRRIALHPYINLTVIRFLTSSSSSANNEKNDYIDDTTHNNDEVLMAISNQQMEAEIDNAFIGDFHSRYVTQGHVGYIEKLTDNGKQTVEVLREVAEMYSLFIVGKGGRGHCSNSTGLSDWEECPELGTVGDLLASSELDIGGSVLVIQQHRHSILDIID